jgi:3D-(3,5/4)-trihydroxycyclohexane-1,2-dione acylhydrolase (decyclizing)
MGYEVAGAIGVKMAAPEREVYSLVGDGSWLMMSTDILTAVQERLKVIVVLIDNHGFGSIGALSESLGSQGFGTRFRYRGDDGGLSGDALPIDFAANARSLGASVVEARSATALADALRQARESDETTVVCVEIDATARFGGSGAWWDVPVAENSELESTREARQRYDQGRVGQGPYLRGLTDAPRISTGALCAPAAGAPGSMRGASDPDIGVAYNYAGPRG